MKDYRVIYDSGDHWCAVYLGTMEEAQALYDSLNGKAEIQKWDPEKQKYEDVVWPTYEF